MKKIDKELLAVKAIDHMKDHWIQKWGFSGEEFDAFAQANMWFLTVTSGHQNPEKAFRYYRKKHHDFLKLMFGSKPARNAHIQPMGYAALDYEGSRSGRMVAAKLLPHVHALMMIHPLTKARFDLIPKEGTIFEGAELYDPNKKNMAYLASYVVKGTIGRNGFRDDEDGKEWEVYPRLTSKTDPQFKHKGRVVPYTEAVPSFSDKTLADLQRQADDAGFKKSVQTLQAIRDYKASRKSRQR